MRGGWGESFQISVFRIQLRQEEEKTSAVTQNRADYAGVFLRGSSGREGIKASSRGGRKRGANGGGGVLSFQFTDFSKRKGKEEERE